MILSAEDIPASCWDHSPRLLDHTKDLPHNGAVHLENTPDYVEKSPTKHHKDIYKHRVCCETQHPVKPFGTRLQVCDSDIQDTQPNGFSQAFLGRIESPHASSCLTPGASTVCLKNGKCNYSVTINFANTLELTKLSGKPRTTKIHNGARFLRSVKGKSMALLSNLDILAISQRN